MSVEDLEQQLNEIEWRLRMNGMMEKSSAVDAIGSQRETIRQGLERRKRQHEAQLESINEAIAMLDKSPEFEGVFNAVQKAGF